MHSLSCAVPCSNRVSLKTKRLSRMGTPRRDNLRQTEVDLGSGHVFFNRVVVVCVHAFLLWCRVTVSTVLYFFLSNVAYSIMIVQYCAGCCHPKRQNFPKNIIDYLEGFLQNKDDVDKLICSLKMFCGDQSRVSFAWLACALYPEYVPEYACATYL